MSKDQSQKTEIPESKLSKSDWLSQGLEALRLYGIRSLNIEALADYIGVTKGSFYWHFKNRKEFYKDLIEYWEQELTRIPIEKVMMLSEDPVLRLRALMEFVLDEELGKYDSDMRTLAAIEDIAEKAILRVDIERMSYAKTLFEEMGFSKKEADVRSRIFYLHFIGEFTVFKDKKERSKYIEEKHKFFTLR